MGYGWCYDRVGNRCTGRVEPGAHALGDWCKARWDLPLVGIYNCRDTVFGTPSVHGEGRADDLHVHVRGITDPPRGDERRKGDEMWAFLIDHAQDIGVQQVIWLDKDWNSISREVTDYGGLFHGNHVHVELCWAAARTLTTAVLDALVAPVPLPPIDQEADVPIIIVPTGDAIRDRFPADHDRNFICGRLTDRPSPVRVKIRSGDARTLAAAEAMFGERVIIDDDLGWDLARALYPVEVEL